MRDPNEPTNPAGIEAWRPSIAERPAMDDDDNEFGTPEERAAVRQACLALRTFNEALYALRRMRIECTLTQDGISTYNADFVKRQTILPPTSPE